MENLVKTSGIFFCSVRSVDKSQTLGRHIRTKKKTVRRTNTDLDHCSRRNFKNADRNVPLFFFTLLWNFVILLCDSPLFHFSIVCLMVGARQQQVPALAPVVTVNDRVWKMDVAIWLWNEVSLCSLRLRKWRNVILKLQGRSPAENTLLQMGHRAEPTSESRSKTATFCQLSGPHDGRAPSTVRTRKGLHKYMK